MCFVGYTDSTERFALSKRSVTRVKHHKFKKVPPGASEASPCKRVQFKKVPPGATKSKINGYFWLKISVKMETKDFREKKNQKTRRDII